MSSLATRIGLPLAVLACTVALAGCSSTSKPSSAGSGSGDSSGADTSSTIYRSECAAMVKYFTDTNLPASAKNPDKLIADFKAGPQWSLMSSQQQTDAVAGIRKAATGSCS